MAELWGREFDGFRTTKYWRHVGDDGKDRITVETVEDAEPVMRAVKARAQSNSSKSAFRFKASIPVTLLEETAKVSAGLWGVSVREAFSELVTSKTDRAKRVMKMLTEGRDYNKLQAKTYEP